MPLFVKKVTAKVIKYLDIPTVFFSKIANEFLEYRFVYLDGAESFNKFLAEYSSDCNIIHTVKWGVKVTYVIYYLNKIVQVDDI